MDHKYMNEELEPGEGRSLEKELKEIREKRPWFFSEPPKIIINKNNPPILVYQMGKVGSSSIVYTLRQNKLSNPIYHVHQLRYDGIDKNIKNNNERLNKNKENKNISDYTRVYTDIYLKYIIRNVKSHRLLRKKIDENMNDVTWKIITLVRDPIMREISDFFFSFHKHPELMGKEGQLLKEETIRILKKELIEKFRYPHNWVLTWFDKELKEVFGVDVYQFPFNHDKGYIIIQSKNINVLIIKLEELDRCFSDAIFEFLNKKDLKLLKRNVAEQKFYYNTYKYILDNIIFNYNFCGKIYASKYSKHFYSIDERENFIMNWTKNLNK